MQGRIRVLGGHRHYSAVADPETHGRGDSGEREARAISRSLLLKRVSGGFSPGKMFRFQIAVREF